MPSSWPLPSRSCGCSPTAGASGTAQQSIDVPVLLLHGDRDRLVPIAAARAAARANPSWQFEVAEGIGHVPQLEAPEWTADRILGWIAAHPEMAQQAAHGTRAVGRSSGPRPRYRLAVVPRRELPAARERVPADARRLAPQPRRARPRLCGVPGPRGLPPAGRSALSTACPASSARHCPAVLGRRSALLDRLPRAAHGDPRARRPGPAAGPRGSSDVAAAGPGPAAVGDVAGRGPAGREMGGHQQGPPRDDRWGLRSRHPRDPAGPDGGRCRVASAAVDATTGSHGGRRGARGCRLVVRPAGSARRAPHVVRSRSPGPSCAAG